MIDTAGDVPGHGAEHGDGKKRGDRAVGDGAHRQGVTAVGAHNPVGDVEIVFFAGQASASSRIMAKVSGARAILLAELPIDFGLDFRAA